MTTPGALATRARRAIAAAADPRVARQSLKYFKEGEKVTFRGVSTPTARAIARELFHEVKGVWGYREAADFCDLLVASKVMEEKNVGFFLLRRYAPAFERGLLPRIKSWLEAGHCSNWAATDAMCGEVLSPLLTAFEDLVPEIAPWSNSRNLWVRRSSLVGLVPLARRGKHLAAAYATAGHLFPDGEDLIRKAAGWLLREAGRTDPDRLEAFLIAGGERIPRTTVRYAIERFPATLRRDILTRTRASRPPRGNA